MIFFKRVLIKLHTSYVEQAMTMYREVLKQKPDDADTLNFQAYDSPYLEISNKPSENGAY